MPAKKQTYIVKNPNGTPSDVRVIAWESPSGKAYEWFEGDSFDAPRGLNIERLLRQGFIVED